MPSAPVSETASAKDGVASSDTLQARRKLAYEKLAALGLANEPGADGPAQILFDDMNALRDGLSKIQATKRATTVPGTGERATPPTAAKHLGEVLFAAPTIMGALSVEQIQRVMRRVQQQLRHCYEKEIRKRPALSGGMTLRFIINGQGRVANVKTEKNTLDDQQTARCIERVVIRLYFPKPKGGGIVIVNYPLRLSLTPSKQRSPSN